MNKRILWIDDDFETIQGLFFYVKKEGFLIDSAISAHEGYNRALNWQKYDLIVVDLILPISNQSDSIPLIVRNWKSDNENGDVGINLIKWMISEQKVGCPVAILSIVPDPILTYNITHLNIAGQLQKESLTPTTLKEQIFEILKIQQDQ
ncbi:MAG: hypothetical protein HY865_11315 [Chloroflexi bacterium]|nr:hypothetical protein [Chloroflexota bacterium]